MEYVEESGIGGSRSQVQTLLKGAEIFAFHVRLGAEYWSKNYYVGSKFLDIWVKEEAGFRIG